MNSILLALVLVSGPTLDKAFEYPVQVNVTAPLGNVVKTYESAKPFDFYAGVWHCQVVAVTDTAGPVPVQTHYTQCQLPSGIAYVTVLGYCYAGSVSAGGVGKYITGNVEALVMLSGEPRGPGDFWVVTSACTMAPNSATLYK